jgi:hypothetical protein
MFIQFPRLRAGQPPLLMQAATREACASPVNHTHRNQAVMVNDLRAPSTVDFSVRPGNIGGTLVIQDKRIRDNILNSSRFSNPLIAGNTLPLPRG